MKVLELFAGTRSIGRAFEARGHEVYSVEWNKDFENIDLYEDISKVTAQQILDAFGKPDVIWASPDCTTYSIAAISHHRKKNKVTGNLDAVSDYAKFCDKTNKHVLDLIHELSPKWFFIENPRGGLRKMNFMQGIPKYTVTYCQYGDTRMKPTDIFTNYKNPNFLPPCHNRDNCHDRAPRSSTVRYARELGITVKRLGGTQYGCKNSRDRSRIPKQLCDYIVDLCEGKVRQTDKQLSFFEEESNENL